MTPKKKATSKKRNPQDATLRNIRALKKRLGLLDVELEKIEHAVRTLAYFVEIGETARALGRIDSIIYAKNKVH